MSRPCGAVDEGERGLHGIEVELFAPRLDVRFDAAVGDGERLAVGEQDHLVRADAVGRHLADALVAAGRVVDADEAGARLVVVLGGVQQPAVAREDAVTVEVAVGRRREQHRLAAVLDVEGKRERSGPAGEHHRLAAGAVERDVVAAPFERQLAQHGAVERQHHDRIRSVGTAAGGHQIAGFDARSRAVVEHAGKRARSARRREGERRADQEMPPVNRHRAH